MAQVLEVLDHAEGENNPKTFLGEVQEFLAEEVKELQAGLVGAPLDAGF